MNEKKKQEKKVVTSIRLKESVYNKVAEEAEKMKRSVTAEIEWICERYFEITEKK